MRDSRLDVVERAAPQPVVVIEVRETRAALSARPMARRAIVAEHGFAARQRDFHELIVPGDIRERHRLDLLQEFRPALGNGP